MKMACSNYVLPFILLAICLINSVQLVSGNGNQNNVQKACSVTRYQDLCIHSLASFSRSAKSSPSRWARAAVSVTLSDAKSVAQYLLALQKHSRINGRRSRVALSDCIECFQNAIDELHKSLGVLRSLSRTTFDTQMGDLNTWLSAALTNGDTCLDGFEGQRGRQVKLLHNKVLKATHITSNALALANKLAATGLESLPHS